MRRLTLWRLVLSNLARRRFRTIALVGLVAVVTGGMALLITLLAGLSRGVQQGTDRFGADLVVLPRGGRAGIEGAMIVGRPTELTLPASVLDQVRRLPTVGAASPQIYIKTLTDAACCPGEFFLIGFDPASDFTLRPWLRRHAGPIGESEAVVGHRVTLRAGSRVRFFGTPFRIVGQLERTGVGIDSTVFLPLPGVREMVRRSPERAEEPLDIAPDEISVVLVKAADGVRPTEVAEAISNAVDGVEVVLAPQVIAAAQRDLGRVLRLLAVCAALLWVVLFPALGLAFAMAVAERRRDIGLQRALGATARFIFGSQLAEAGLIGAGGGLLGVSLATVLVVAFAPAAAAESFETPYLWGGPGFSLALAAGLLTAAWLTASLAAWPPARAAARLDPYECIRRAEA